MADLINPYIAGAPVTEQRMFFGREDVFRWIENSLTGQYSDHILVIHGQRRVGKTSVLKQLGNRLPHRYIPVFFDLQGRTHTSLDRFLWWLAREIVRVLKQERGITVPAPEKDAFAADPEYFETHFLPGLEPHIGDRSLLLTFDEFDNLEESEVKEELARPLIDYLRRLMGEQGVNFIFSIGSSGRKLENMQAEYTEFFKAALYKKISFLSREQTAGLIARPVEGLLEYEPQAVERIFDITSGHPYFTQLTCHELFSLCQRTGELRIREADVEAILDDVVERGTVNLKFTWDEASDLEKWSLATLAQLDKTDNRALADFLRKQRVRFSDSDLTSGLLHLREKDILTEENRFVIYLLKLWLKKNRSLEQVREELTEVNPIANRYIEIGQEFHDSRLYDKAIENFKQALEISPDNLQAQVNIAQAYMAQGALIQAVAEFEKALAMDDEDVASRAGLCEAYLALGDAAHKKGKTGNALQAYQKVLSINAEHTEARQRMAEISRGRAEKALADGRDEEALSAFAEALRFTPEDEALSARYEQAKVEKRTKVLASLLSKADKEQAARNWEAALEILENALEIAPGEEKIQGRLAVVKAEQRKEALQAILARAGRAESAGRWGLVIAALEEYLALEPGASHIQARIETARQKLTEAQVEEARARARGLARQERFEEAVTAWGEYLKINPTDTQTAQAELEHIHKAQSLARNYAEAQKAFSRKNYDHAIGLFKSIVVENADYKDATRLMAEAIELRRTQRKWWQNRWLWGSVSGLALLAVAWVMVRPGSPLMGALLASIAAPVTATAPAAALVTDSSPATEIPDLPPTVTPTPLPLAWTRLNSGQFLPRDQVTAMIVDPTDPGVMYVGTGNAGIYKSIDGGLSWQPAQYGLARSRVASLVIDANNPAILYAGTGIDGVYATKNGGESWEAIFSTNHGDPDISVVRSDPQNSQRLYFSSGEAIYRSDDGGRDWQPIEQPSCNPFVVDLAAHPANRQALFILDVEWDGKCKAGLYTVNGEPPGNWEITSLNGSDFEHVNNTTISAFEDLLYVSNPTALFSSIDGGLSWQELLRPGCDVFSAQPGNAQVAYCLENSGKIFSTGNAGKSWTTSNTNIPGEYSSLTISPHNPETAFAGSTGLWQSINKGIAWIERNSGLAAGRLRLSLAPNNSTLLYLEDAFGTLYQSSDNGKNWDMFSNEGHGLAIDTSSGVLYRAENGLLRSNTNGQTWEILDSPTTANGLAVFAPPQLPEVVFYYGDAAPYLWISRDAGKSWESASGISSTSNGSLYFSENQSKVYLTGESKVHFSNDNGSNWEQCQDTGYWLAASPTALAIHPIDSRKIWLATWGGGIRASNDGCMSWHESNKGLGSLYVNTLAIDPNNPDTLYAGTDGGAYISYDAGATWDQVNDGLLGATVVYSIVVDKESNVYAATPYGIFKLESE
jgi:tetratricopeptide (TPR) repeat protein/photosystem II stability/assembly factor-like uncharacterized protein